ncbi:ATP-binding protein [Streptomyces sp. NPDC087437]|uniref:ATP-binding protein n=1 Tax=Streptomyces sp. NPDC087437 TaxID=3365789 RepID=UPI003812E13E
MARRGPECPRNGFTVAAAADAVPAARRQVVSLAQDLGLPLSDQALETVELLAGELIANAVQYTHAPCDVSVRRADERLRVEVTDTNASVPSVVEAGANDESGRGLLLVNALAADWGTQPEPTGKTTWFEIVSEPSTDGMGSNSASAPPSPCACAPRRTEGRARMASSANSQSSFGSPTMGKQYQAA